MWRKLEKKYFDSSLSRGFLCLYAGRSIMFIASSFVGLFIPIFIYELLGKNLAYVLVYYGLGYVIYSLTVVFGAKFLNKFGFKKALQLSVVFAVIYYIFMYGLEKTGNLYILVFLLFALVLWRLTYWLPYHVDFAKFTNKKTRSRQISFLEATRALSGIVIPLVAGYILIRFGYSSLFIIALVLYILSGIPYLYIPRTREKFSWTVKQTWEQFVSKKNRKLVLAYFADGAENVVGVIIWPIFIYQLLNGNYFQVGAVSSFIIGMTVIIQLFLGRYIDNKKASRKVLGWGTFLYSFGWFIKIFISTAFQIFIVGAYHNVANLFVRTSFDSMAYEIAADQEHYVDEYTVLHEISIQLGKSVMVVFAIFISVFLSIQWIFALAAVAAITLSVLRKQGYQARELQ